LLMVNNSAADCPIALKFIRDYDHATPDLLQTFKVNGSKVKVTARGNVSAAKNAISQAWIG